MPMELYTPILVLGGLAAAAGFWLSQPHRTPCDNARRRIPWMRRIVAGASLFTPGRDAKVIGEAWFDERSKITVVVVGLAQTQGAGLTGQQYRDTTHWHRMVADPGATIQSPGSADGLIYNVRSHGS
jgi:hypothetical protein